MPRNQTVDIINLGCSKNLVDSEQLLTQLLSNGYVVRMDPDRVEADVLIINTCGFIHDAREESVNTILQAIEARRSGRIHEIRVMGCLVQRYAHDLKTHIPEIDRWYGVNDLKPILDDFSIPVDEELLRRRMHTTPDHYAYLKVSEGCNRNCTFCAIPGIRGKYQSRPVEALVDEAEYLAGRGVKELILIAQDLTYYGNDLYKTSMLAPLVRQLNEVRGLEWIRLHYTYPAGFPMELLDVMKVSEKVCPYIDIPLQHIADPILKAMNRGIGKAATIGLLNKIRTTIQDVALRTTMLVGFPGETDKDFEELLDFVSDFRFERLGVFTYSHEEGTWAGENLKDKIPQKIKQERADRLMQVQQEISLSINESWIGREIRVIIDRRDSDVYVGRTVYDSPEVDQEVIINAPQGGLTPGDIIDVVITEAGEFDLTAEPSSKIL